MNSLKVEVEGFGPITRAAVELKPLTVFVGRNGTGKSYLAQLLYSICKAGETTSRWAKGQAHFYAENYRFLIGRYGIRYPEMYRMDELLPSPEMLSSLRGSEFLNNIVHKLREFYRHPTTRFAELELNYNDLPLPVREFANRRVMADFDRFQDALTQEISESFDTRINNLISKFSGTAGFSIRILNTEPNVSLAFKSQANRLKIVEKKFSLSGDKITVRIEPTFLRAFGGSEDRTTLSKMHDATFEDIWATLFAGAVLESVYAKIYSIFPPQSYYLPAARTGILLGQKAIMRVGLRALKRVGLKSISIPKLPGSVIDFLDTIYDINKNERGDYARLADTLERTLLMGKIDLLERKEEVPEIVFKQPTIGRLELHRTSAMTSEIAPIVLLLRYVLRKNDLMIIEEPESHLHPRAQRDMATLFSTLANEGANVLITTHSDYFLQQISNLIAHDSQIKRRLRKLGYENSSIMSPQKVAVYLFQPIAADSGNIVKVLNIDDKGINEEEFAAVAEELFQEAAVLSDDTKGDSGHNVP